MMVQPQVDAVQPMEQVPTEGAQVDPADLMARASAYCAQRWPNPASDCRKICEYLYASGTEMVPPCFAVGGGYYNICYYVLLGGNAVKICGPFCRINGGVVTCTLPYRVPMCPPACCPQPCCPQPSCCPTTSCCPQPSCCPAPSCCPQRCRPCRPRCRGLFRRCR